MLDFLFVKYSRIFRAQGREAKGLCWISVTFWFCSAGATAVCFAAFWLSGRNIKESDALAMQHFHLQAWRSGSKRKKNNKWPPLSLSLISLSQRPMLKGVMPCKASAALSPSLSSPSFQVLLSFCRGRSLGRSFSPFYSNA